GERSGRSRADELLLLRRVFPVVPRGLHRPIGPGKHARRPRGDRLMDWIVAASLGIFACAIFSGVPIPFGFLISIIFLSITKGIDPSFLLPVGFTSINSVTLLSMPFFITLGYLVTGGSIARRLL